MTTPTTEGEGMNGSGCVHLIGGGRDEDALAPLIFAFVQDAARGGAERPLISALLVVEEDDTDTEERFRRMLTRAGARPRTHTIREGATFDAKCISGVDGILVGGGLTPAYHAAFVDIAPLVRASVAAGATYLGFSAGAAIAADRALIGGYALDGVDVCDPDAGEELSDVTVVDGLGLAPFTVDVHAAQWGTVTRLSAVVAEGLVESGIAIDEHTAVVLATPGEGMTAATVKGHGAAWVLRRDHRTPGEHGVHMERVRGSR